MSGVWNGGQGYQMSSQTALTTAFVLPPETVAGVDADELDEVAKIKEGQMLWFAGCPTWVSHRYAYEPLPPQLEFCTESHLLCGQRLAQRLGHSAKYMAWKLRNKTDV